MSAQPVVVQSVTGPTPVEAITLVDGHAHAWIHPPEGVDPAARIELDNEESLRAELSDFYAAGGRAIVDCQPGGGGRDARALRRLSQATGVVITCTTGFHQQKYYPPESWLWTASEDDATATFVEELRHGTRESTTNGSDPIRAAVIKIGFEGTFEGQTRVLMEAAARAARQTGCSILFHTEQGRNAEALLPFFSERGVPPTRLYICHVDKRADEGFHKELAQAGALLGYDTFARPKYDPDRNVWRLVKTLVAAGLESQVAIGLDLAFPSNMQHFGGAPGLRFLPDQVLPRLRAEGIGEDAIRKLTAQNVLHRLAWTTSGAE